jgi:hypothetical protein
MARFQFNPFPVQNAADPVVYQVKEMADGTAVGTIVYDGVNNRWGFVVGVKSPHIAVGGADAAEISTFCSATPLPTQVIGWG